MKEIVKKKGYEKFSRWDWTMNNYNISWDQSSKDSAKSWIINHKFGLIVLNRSNLRMNFVLVQ